NFEACKRARKPGFFAKPFAAAHLDLGPAAGSCYHDEAADDFSVLGPGCEFLALISERGCTVGEVVVGADGNESLPDFARNSSGMNIPLDLRPRVTERRPIRSGHGRLRPQSLRFGFH